MPEFSEDERAYLLAQAVAALYHLTGSYVPGHGLEEAEREADEAREAFEQTFGVDYLTFIRE